MQTNSAERSNKKKILMTAVYLAKLDKQCTC